MEQSDLLDYVIDVLERAGLVYIVVGSMASSAYGEPRFTQDIDVVIEVNEEQVEQLCAVFPSGEFYVSLEAARIAVRMRTQFNVIHPESGNKVDFMIARTDLWGREQMRRGRRLRLTTGRQGFAAAPEDVILSKMIYYREGGSEKHLRDITGILKVSGDEVDRNYVAHWAEALQVADVWEAILRRLK